MGTSSVVAAAVVQLRVVRFAVCQSGACVSCLACCRAKSG